MAIYLVLFLCSCLIALFFTPVLRQAAARNGFLDYPNERKLHKGAIPRVGGVAIAVASFIAISLGYAIFRHDLNESASSLASFAVGGVLIVLLGTWDDLWRLSPRKKLLGQIVVASILVPFGFAIHELNIPFVGVIKIGWKISIPLTIFWVVGIINTINFIDGMDGLAAGVALIISCVLFALSIISGKLFMGIICIAIAGGIVGFLRHNFHPANIFMGDSGAMFLGFSLAAVSLKVLFQSSSSTPMSVVPILIFGLPIVDTTWAIIRRLINHVSPFRADGLHIHHRLISIGLTQRKAVVILYFAGLLSALVGLVIALTGNETLAVILAASMLIISIVAVMILGRAAPFEPTET